MQSVYPVDDVAEFLDVPAFNRIINKITDYAEFIPEGKLAGIINFNYTLNSTQTNKIIELLISLQAVSRISIMALKGSRDLESEYVSNILSDTTTPESISSYLNLRNLVENRLSHQVQQYDMNMGKNNTTMAIPLNELRGHVKTYIDLTKSEVMVSTKAQHGMIAASLHDAYIILLNKTDYWNDKTYMKFFFNDDDSTRREHLLITRDSRLSLSIIAKNIEDARERLARASAPKQAPETAQVPEIEDMDKFDIPTAEERAQDQRSRSYTDRMLATPFGKQYGQKIDQILEEIFSDKNREKNRLVEEETVRGIINPLYQKYLDSASLNDYGAECVHIAEYLLAQDLSVKTVAEKFLHAGKKEQFAKFFSETNRMIIESFLTGVFSIFFDMKFQGLFRIIRSLDMKKFACAYIMKRIYLTQGDGITNFGYFLIRTIAKVGGIKMV